MNTREAFATVLISVVTAAATTWLSSRQQRRVSREAIAAERRRLAAVSIRDAVWQLHDVAHDALVGREIDGRRVARTIEAFERSLRRQEDLLPDDARHLRQSAREAMGNAFGAPALSALDVRAGEFPLSETESYWVDLAVTWFDHAVSRLHAWEDDPQRKRIGLVRFHQWRQDDDPPSRLASRSS